jgi:hypothetical protein
LENEAVLSKTMKTGARKKRSREEASGSAERLAPPTSPSCLNPNKVWKKSKAKTEDLLALLNSSFLWEKELDMWRAAAGDPYPMEKNPRRDLDVHPVRRARVGPPGE